MVDILKVEMAYYNSKYALWEPVIEPIGKILLQNLSQKASISKSSSITISPTLSPGYLTSTGRTQYNRWSLDIRYQANSSHDLGSAVLSPNFAVDDVDGFICPENLPPLTEIGIHSTETLQITITKSFLTVLNTLTESFSLDALR